MAAVKVFPPFSAFSWHDRSSIITENLCPTDFIFNQEKVAVWNYFIMYLNIFDFFT